MLDERTVLVVDEAGMLGSRKLARLLDHAAAARAKLVLVGDDKQLAAIEACGGFRGLRLRLGASTLTENRRQAELWEREAVEHLRDGNIDAALNAYREHDRLVAVEAPGQLKETMLSDWWQSFQQGNRVVILAYRRDEVDQFNDASQRLRDQEGHLSPERLAVRYRSFAVGDQVVYGKNAIRSLGVANGTRGQVVALDLEQRCMTLKLEDSRQVSLHAEYLDHRPGRWVGNTPTGAPSILPMPPPGTSRRASPATRYPTARRRPVAATPATIGTTEGDQTAATATSATSAACSRWSHDHSTTTATKFFQLP